MSKSTGTAVKMSPVKETTPEEKQLFTAVNTGNVEEVSRLLGEPGVSVDALDEDGMTPLGHAAFKGNKGLAELLLANGANVNSGDHHQGYSPLMFAALSGNTEATRVLLEAGANTTTVNKVGRNAAQMGAFVGQHQCVTLINNFFAVDELEYYTVARGLEKEPKLPPQLLKVLHRMILNPNLNPVNISRYLQEHTSLLDEAYKVAKVLDLLVQKNMKHHNTNDVMAVRCHYLACVVRQCHKQVTDHNDPKLEAWIKSLLRGTGDDGFFETQERFIRSAMKDFPYPESQLLMQIIRNLASVQVGGYPTAFSMLCQSIHGIQWQQDEGEMCTACGEKKAEKKCSACKKVRYCNQSCQKLHWFTHKKFCKRLAEVYKQEEAFRVKEEKAAAKRKQEAEEAKQKLEEAEENKENSPVEAVEEAVPSKTEDVATDPKETEVSETKAEASEPVTSKDTQNES